MSSGQIEDVVIGQPYDCAPKWMQIASKELGQKETDPYSRVHEYFETCGVVPDVRGTPWCRYFVNHCLKKAGWSPPLDGMARGLLSWGDPVTDPKVGDLIILWRGTHDDGVTGHVGFFVKWDGRYVYLLGGNQGDAVTEAKFDRKKIIGIRRPKSMWSSKTNWASSGVAGGGGAQIVEGIVNAPVEQVTEAQGLVQQVMQYFPNYKVMFGMAIFAMGMFILYRRYKDNKDGVSPK